MWRLSAGMLSASFVAMQTHVVPIAGVVLFTVVSLASQTAISQIPRVVATISPLDVQKIIAGHESFSNSNTFQMPVAAEPKRVQSTFTKPPITTASKSNEPVSHYAENITPIGNIIWRKRAHVQGRVSLIKSAPSGSSPLVKVEVWDESGGVTLQFLGRREISGLDVGSQLKAEGMVGEDNGQLIILNPSYEIVT